MSKVKNSKKNVIGITIEKQKNFPNWYVEVLVKSGMIDYSDVKGCYIMRPGSYAIWEFVRKFIDKEIKKEDVENCYFPLFVTKSALCKEEDHLEGFSPEVAWVTKAGHTTFDESQELAIRPTSETAIYPSFSKWIKSHRDLPMKINQWCSVVRWEMKQTIPFIRCREFLWQEGHTAHETEEKANIFTKKMLNMYSDCYEKILAVPVIKGTKSHHEKFAGSLYTTTLEAFIPENGRAIQAATSHNLGQNFSKMFDITYADTDKKIKNVWQTSWGYSVRSLGTYIMIHGDDKGIVHAPNVAPIQVVIVPIIFKKSKLDILEGCNNLKSLLIESGIRCKLDDRDGYSTAYKYNHWELKGVPLRIEFGPRDMKNNTCVLVRRDTKEKFFSVSLATFINRIKKELTEMQSRMLETARAKQKERTVVVLKWENFVPTLNKRCMLLCPWCDHEECELDIKKISKEEAEEIKGDEFMLTAAAKTLCIPHDQEMAGMDLPTKCINERCKNEASVWCLFGRSY